MCLAKQQEKLSTFEINTAFFQDIFVFGKDYGAKNELNSEIMLKPGLPSKLRGRACGGSQFFYL